MRLNELNRLAVLLLLKDADVLLELAGTDASPVSTFPTTRVNLRSGYRDLTRRGMPLIMTDDQQTAFQSKMDRLSARLRFLGEFV